jgi:ATP-binding cassette subfamily B protein
MSRAADLRLVRRLLGQARPYWGHIAAVFLLNMLAIPLALLAPVPLKIAVDCVIGSDALPGFLAAVVPGAVAQSESGVLVFAAGLVVGIALLTRLQALGSSLLRTYTGERLVLGFRGRLFRHVQRLSLGYHDTRGTADSLYRIQYDAAVIQYVALDVLIPFITAAITVIAMLYVTLRIDWQLALVALAISPVLVMTAQAYRRNLRRQSREVKNLETASLSVIQEVLGGIRVVKAFGQEDREEDRFVRRSHQGMRARLRLALAEGNMGLLIGLTTAIGTAAVLFIGVRHVLAGYLTLGALLLVMAYLAQLYAPLKTISRKVASLQSHLASAERAYAVLDEATDVPERPHARDLVTAAGDVSFRDVSFAYEEEYPVLQGICFEVVAGTRLGIAGTTGAGKTTLVSLLMRFYDPTAGQILLDGHDLRDYRLEDLRDQFALVLQEPVLFSTSIAENIAYARPGASVQQIEQAAKAANAHDFIVGLPSGYETLVGERGMRLSGGERQRIGLARAFLKDAPVLILDEPTSSVDLRTEAGIMDSMERLMQGRTTFMIAHRLSTLKNCDHVLVIEDGQVLSATSDVDTVLNDAFLLEKLRATETHA